MENNIIQFNENCLICSRKRKRDNYDNNINYRKRKIEDDLDDILISKFKKIEIININNKKRTYADIVDDIYDDTYDDIFDRNIKLQIKKQKINKTYNCTLHDDTKEICLVYNCSGNINMNDNIVYNYIK